jgi:hypothetical protein
MGASWGKVPILKQIFQICDRLAPVCSFFSCQLHGVRPIVPSSEDRVLRRESIKTPKSYDCGNR